MKVQIPSPCANKDCKNVVREGFPLMNKTACSLECWSQASIATVDTELYTPKPVFRVTLN